MNIIPEKAVLQLAVRAPLDRDVALLKEKVVACFNAAATATGCQVTLIMKSDLFKIKNVIFLPLVI